MTMSEVDEQAIERNWQPDGIPCWNLADIGCDQMQRWSVTRMVWIYGYTCTQVNKVFLTSGRVVDM